MSRSRVLLLTAAAIIIGAVAVSALLAATTASPSTTATPSPILTNIAAQDLDAGHLTVTAATTTPTVTSSEAVSAAQAQWPGFPVRQAVYAHLKDPRSHNDSDCWIVDMTPPGPFIPFTGPIGDPNTPPPSATFLLVIVDGHTGQVLYGVAA